MDDRLASRLVPDGLWEIVEPLIPPSPVRRQGGGRRRVDDRAVFTAIVFVLTSGCAWRHLPATFGVTPPTAHRRFQEWTEAGLWARLHRAMLDRLGTAGERDCPLCGAPQPGNGVGGIARTNGGSRTAGSDR